MTLTRATYFITKGAPDNVLDYGAVGDGVADDTAAIQAAIDGAAGKALFFPEGDYLVTGPLTITAAVSLFGEYGHSTIINNVVGDDLFHIGDGTPEVAEACAGTEFRWLNIKQGNVAIEGDYTELLWGQNVKDLTIDSCTFYGAYDDEALAVQTGLYFDNMQGLVISNCVFERFANVSYGIYFIETNQNIRITNCDFGVLSQIGILFWGAASNALVENCSAVLTYTDFTASFCVVCTSERNVQVVNCTVTMTVPDYGSQDYNGILVLAGSDILVSECNLLTQPNALDTGATVGITVRLVDETLDPNFYDPSLTLTNVTLSNNYLFRAQASVKVSYTSVIGCTFHAEPSNISALTVEASSCIVANNRFVGGTNASPSITVNQTVPDLITNFSVTGNVFDSDFFSPITITTYDPAGAPGYTEWVGDMPIASNAAGNTTGFPSYIDLDAGSPVISYYADDYLSVVLIPVKTYYEIMLTGVVDGNRRGINRINYFPEGTLLSIKAGTDGLKFFQQPYGAGLANQPPNINLKTGADTVIDEGVVVQFLFDGEFWNEVG